MADAVTARAVWDQVSGPLRDDIGESAWKAWFVSIEATDLVSDTLELSVPAELFRRAIHDRYLAQIESTMSDTVGIPLRASVVVRAPSRPIRHESNLPPPALLDHVGGLNDRDLVAANLAHAIDTTTIRNGTQANIRKTPQVRPTHTFDNFIIGESNRFAHAAAMAVAESPAAGYNPLFIWGATGLGKTHLLHAIVNYIETVADLRATYTSSEQFTNEFIEMIRSDTRSEFRDRHRSTDVLLIDDIQFLAGKVETQNEFFHTFNHLHQSDKQIVIASDRPPKEISHLEDRLRSRFEWGLMTDIQPPDLETRIAILRNKAERSRLTVPDDVIEFIAHRISDNIRELEGALNRIAAYAKLEGSQITFARAEDLLAGIGNAGNRPVTSNLILRETSAYYDLEIEELIGPSRRRPLVGARQVSMYLHRELTDLSLPRIGEIFGGRDHTTVLHAQRKVETLMHEKRQLLQQVTELANRIKLG